MPRKTIQLRAVKAMVPVNYPDLDSLIYPKNNSADHIRALANQIRIARFRMMRTDPENRPWYFEEGWVPLHSTLLSQVLSKGYKKRLRFAIQEGLIEERSSYIAGKQSKLYRIPAQYLNLSEPGKRYRYEVIQSHKVLKGIWTAHAQLRTKIDERLRSIHPVYVQLRYMTNTVKYDVNSAEAFLYNTTNDSLNPETCDFLLWQMEQHNEGVWEYVKVDDFGYRFHSNHTGIWNELRSYLIFDGVVGEPIVAADVRNSQAFFAAASICCPQIYDTILPEFNIFKPLAMRLQYKPDAIKFYNSCVAGNFYEEWLNLVWPMYTHTPVNIPAVRAKAKEELFETIFFGATATYGKRQEFRARKNALKDAFRWKYPSVWEFFCKVKYAGKEDLPFMDKFYFNKKGKYVGNRASYKNLSCMMQRFESRMILQNVSYLFTKSNPAVTFITIHDSFVLPERDMQELKLQFDKSFAMYGIAAPTLKIDRLLR
jgi:hypothetical protein